jgi:hypothetical protein
MNISIGAAAEAGSLLAIQDLGEMYPINFVRAGVFNTQPSWVRPVIRVSSNSALHDSASTVRSDLCTDREGPRDRFRQTLAGAGPWRGMLERT